MSQEVEYGDDRTSDDLHKCPICGSEAMVRWMSFSVFHGKITGKFIGKVFCRYSNCLTLERNMDLHGPEQLPFEWNRICAAILSASDTGVKE